MNMSVHVFIVSRKNNPYVRRVLWRVSRADAMKICSDDRTFSSRHMLCWTTQDMDDPKWFKFVKDSGLHDDVLKEHGVEILESHETQEA